jgi:hypothetical protein
MKMKKCLTNQKNRIMQVIAMFLALTMLSFFVLNAMAESGVVVPAAAEPAVEEVLEEASAAAEEPVVETPEVAEEPAAAEPAVEEVVEEAPAAAEPAAEEVVEEAPAAAEPAAEEVVEEPPAAAEEPVVETPAVNNEEPLAEEPESDNIVLAGDLAPRGVDIYLYASDDVNSQIIAHLSADDEVIVLQHIGKWVEVNYLGRVGYIAKFKVEAEVVASEAVNTADVKEEGEALADEEPSVEGADVAEECEVLADEESAAEDSDVEVEGEVLADEEPVAEDSEVETEAEAECEALADEDFEVEVEGEALAAEEFEVEVEGEALSAEEAAAEEPASEEAKAEEPAQTEVPVEEKPADLPVQEEVIDMQEILDRDFPNRSVDIIYHLNGKEGITFGDNIYFTAILNGYEGLEYSLNWQYNIGGSDWADIPGEVSENYVLTIDQNNQNWNVRVLVTITGVVEP